MPSKPSKKRSREDEDDPQEVIVLDASPSPSSQDEVIFISSSSSSGIDPSRGSSQVDFDIDDDDINNVEVIDDDDVGEVVVQNSASDRNGDMQKSRSSVHPKTAGIGAGGGGGGGGGERYDRAPTNFDFFAQQRMVERERLIRSRGTYGTSLRLRSAGYEVEFDNEHKVVKKHKFPLSEMNRSVKLKFRSDGEFDHEFIRKIKELEGLPVLESGSIPVSVWKVPEPLGFFAAQSGSKGLTASTSEVKVDGVTSSDDGAKGSEPQNFDDPMQSGYYAPLQGLVPSSAEASKMTKAQKKDYRKKLAALAESYWSSKPAMHSSSAASSSTSASDPVTSSSSSSSTSSLKGSVPLRAKIEASLPPAGSTVRRLQSEQERLLEEAAASFAEQLKNDRLRRSAMNSSSSSSSSSGTSAAHNLTHMQGDGWIEEQHLTREVAIATAAQSASPRGILGLGSKMAIETGMLRKRYYFLAKLLHPDKVRAEKDAEGGSANASSAVIEKAINAFKAVSLAYETILKETGAGRE